MESDGAGTHDDDTLLHSLACPIDGRDFTDTGF